MADAEMNTAADTKELKEEFWVAAAKSPFVLVSRDGADEHAIPMRMQLDEDAKSAIWLFTSRDNRLAAGGPAMMQFASKGHDLFACVAGNLTEETKASVIDKHWSNAVEAWYEQGREDSSMLMLRMDLKDAEIWEADPSIKGYFKMLTGSTMDGDEMGEHARVSL